MSKKTRNIIIAALSFIVIRLALSFGYKALLGLSDQARMDVFYVVAFASSGLVYTFISKFSKHN